MSWTDDRVATLKKLWGEGLSATQIACRMDGVTRNSVISKVHRLNLPPRTLTKRSNHSGSIAKPSRIQGTRNTKRKTGLKPTVPGTGGLKSLAAEMKEALPAEGPAEGYLITDLKNDQCRWPINDAAPGADHLFCGAQCADQSPYCPEHAERNLQPRMRKMRKAA